MGENFKSSNKIHPVVSNILVDDLHITSILSNQNITINVDHEIDKDEALILALGYKQEFKREFSLWTYLRSHLVSWDYFHLSQLVLITNSWWWGCRQFHGFWRLFLFHRLHYPWLKLPVRFPLHWERRMRYHS